MSCIDRVFMDNNSTIQTEELEALAAIYGDEWCVLDESACTYLIRIGPENSKYSACLQVQLPADYPSGSPPVYLISAPWLRGGKRAELSNLLEDIYTENIGECIIYLWVEKIREFLHELADTETDKDENCESHFRVTNVSEEIDDDDGFQFDELQMEESKNLKLTPVSEGFKCPAVYHDEPFSERRSTFQAHLAPVLCKEHIKLVLSSLYENKKIANATHNILAYRIYIAEPQPYFIQGCDDDGECHAGSRILHMMQITDVRNVMVVVTRWYGGILLGPDRFKFINNAARHILESHGFIRNKVEKKGPKSTFTNKKINKYK